MKMFDQLVCDVICEYLIRTMPIKLKVARFTSHASHALFAGQGSANSVNDYHEDIGGKLGEPCSRSSIAVGDEFILKDTSNPGTVGQMTSPYCKHHYDQSNGFFGETGNIPEDEKYTESSGSPGLPLV